jgi:hypothetical protein
MKQKRLRTQLLQVWLHPKEYEFLTSHAEDNLLTTSELIRYWVRKAMIKEGLFKDVAIETKKGR